MTEAEQARKDPRVGDKWTTPDGYKTSIMDVVKVDGGWITFRAYGGVSKLDNEHFLKFVKRWTLAERGPAPATNERDPATTPVVGDEWEQNRETIKVVSINSDARVIQRITNSKRQSTAWSTPVVDWPEWVKGWRLHRKGDDPAWRPEGERSDAPAFEWTKRKCDARKAAREFSAETSADYKDAEQPAHAIKVGDRVRHNDGDKGTVDEIADSHVFTKYDSGASGRTLLSEWQQVLTIIPPAAEPEQDDTGDEPPTPEPMPFATYQPDPVEEQRYRDSKYIRVIRSIGGKTAIEVDVYEVLEAFAVNCPATAHALKKILCAGIRGSKSRMQDLREARDSIMRAMEMQHQREAVAAAKGST